MSVATVVAGAFSDKAVDAARWELSLFIAKEAGWASQRLGFGWVGASEAPGSFADLKAAFARSSDQKIALPVSQENLARTIYVSRMVDLQLRFWHDVAHVERERSFSTPDEFDLGLWHVARASAAGLSALAVALLDADLTGQTLLYAATKTHALDQFTFDIDVLMFGVADAIVLERDRQVAHLRSSSR